MKAWGLPRDAGSLLLDYHVRAALAGATLCFALLALSVSALRKGWVATAGIGVVSCALYTSYIFQLGTLSSALFSDERVAVAAAWSPNVTLVVLGAAFWSARREARLQDRPAHE